MSTTSSSAPERVESAAETAPAAPTGSAGGLDLAALLAGGGADLKGLTADPQELVRRWLEQRTAAAQEQADLAAAAEAEDEELSRLDALRAEQQRAEHQARVRELRDLVRDLSAEVEQLRARNDRMAAALGACHICFGTDLACSECGGGGRPGAARPDPSLFRLLVLPAARRLRESASMSPRSGPTTPRAEEAPRPTLYD